MCYNNLSNKQGDDLVMKIKLNAPVSILISAICVGVLLLGRMDVNFISRYFTLGVNAGSNQTLHYINYISNIFGHSGWEHLSGNLTYFLLIAPVVEKIYGSVSLVVMTVLTAIGSSVVFMIVSNGNAGVCGLSGIVYMVIVLVTFTAVSEGSGVIPLTACIVVCIFVGEEVYRGFFVNDNISQLGHISGATFGFVFGLIRNSKHAEPVTPSN